MPNKILVTYATRGGSTKGVANAIAETIADNGVEVDVLPMQEIDDLSDYIAVVAGSAIQMDQWLPEARDFMERHQSQLSQKPFAAFLVCMALALKDDDKTKATVSSWMQPIRDIVEPVSEGHFAGALNLSEIRGLGFQVLARLGILIGFWSEGDYRDWKAIKQWAKELPAKLMKQPIRNEAVLQN